jgi:NitT/TauT family transport system substrate-binding protein
MRQRTGRLRAWRTAAAVTALAMLAAGCASNGGAAAGSGSDAAEVSSDRLEELRLGYFPNVTHAPAIVGVEEGTLADALGDTELTTRTFNSGTEVIEALLSGALDASYIGPSPAINGYGRSEGQALRIVSGATSGGASLVVRDEIDSPDDLAGKTLSTPSLGNTQDVALRAWLADEGFETTLEGGGEVTIQPQDNAAILETFISGQIDGAWVPEPWLTRLLAEGDGHVLVDERDLWPDGQFVTTHLIVSTQLLEDHPDVVRDLLAGHLDTLDQLEGDPDGSQQTVADAIETLTGVGLNPDVLAGAWDNLTFTPDPVADSLRKGAQDAAEAGIHDPVDLDGIYELGLLNELLAERDEPEVSQ